MAVPGLRFSRVAAGVQAGSAKKGRIEGCPHPHRRLLVAGIGGALVKEPCGSDVAGAKEGVAASQQLCDLPGGETRGLLRRRHCG